MKIGSLFSGYGGLDLAVEAIFNAQPAWFCEFDKAPSKVLAHHWPDVPNHKDVTQINWKEVEPVDILTGGSPCQDLSHAGKRAGMTEGTRSNLWVNMREAIAALQPKYVVWENVLGALSAKATSDSDLESEEGLLANTGDGHLRALGRVLGDLTEIGYDARWTTLRASDIGAPTTAPESSSSHGPVFPTLDTNPGGGGQLTTTQRRAQGRTASVNNAVMELAHLPTPCAGDNVNDTESQHNRNSPSLTQVSKHFPTPQAVDGIMGRPRTTGGPDPRKVDTSGVSYAAWVSVADVSASKSLGARRLHQECRLRVL